VLEGVLPSWVEPDPLRSRATDALGLQVVADRLAERLVPGLSVLTTRARYFTFLCWARDQVGRGHDEGGIHRWEVALTLAEARISDEDPTHGGTCRFVGSRNVKGHPRDRLPRDPKRIYKVPAWRAYRASMIALGLVQAPPRFSLRDEGEYAASRFQASVRVRGGTTRPLSDRACLSRISWHERHLLRDLLGVSLRGRLDAEAADQRSRRAAFAREVRHIFRREGLSPENVLPKYETIRSRTLAEPAATLRAAALWERLALGMNVIFTSWVRAIEAGRPGRMERALAALLTMGLRPAALADVELVELQSALAKAVANLRAAVRLHDELRDRGVVLPGGQWFDIARDLFRRKSSAQTRARDVLTRLRQAHFAAKGDDAWINGDPPELSRPPGGGWEVPARVRLHGYRMAAFDSVLRDLGGI
jgi:hypothetical protein